MKEKEKFGLIFDADGVIIDMPHRDIWKEAVKKYGISRFSREDYDALASGIPRKDAAKKIFEYFNIAYDDRLIEELYHQKQEITDRVIEYGSVEIFSSTLDFILEAKADCIRIAVASSSENAAKALKRMKIQGHGDYSGMRIYDLFDYVISGKIKPGKPHPKIFLNAAECIRHFPKECIVFEDSAAGVKASKNAGMYCVGIDRAGNNLKNADLVVPDLSKLPYRELKKCYQEFLANKHWRNK